MFRARDKSKVHFREWVSRILENLRMYLDLIQPRTFSESQLNKVLPVDDVCFEFIFDTKMSEERESTTKFTLKDMRSQT